MSAKASPESYYGYLTVVGFGVIFFVCFCFFCVFSVLHKCFIRRTYYVDHQRKQQEQSCFAKQTPNHQRLCPVPVPCDAGGSHPWLALCWGPGLLISQMGHRTVHTPSTLCPCFSCSPLGTLWPSYLSHSISLPCSRDLNHMELIFTNTL